MQLTTASAAETQAFAARLGGACRGGEVLFLDGTLGAGKTTFVQGLAVGLGVTERVHSPSYTIINEHAGRLPLVHIDLYRLDGGRDVAELGLDEVFASRAVIAVEWPERLGQLAPADRLEIALAGDGDNRVITLRPSGKTATALLEAL